MDNNTTIDENLLLEMNEKMKQAVLPVTIFVGLEAAAGFVGNLFVLYVFLFKYHECNFRYFVLCLAFVDFISTLTTMPGEMITQLNWFIYPSPIYCKVKSFFNVFTVSAEALCLFTIAIDRFRKICQPFRQQINPKAAKILCLVIYIAAFALALPVALMWGVNTHIEYYPEGGRNINVTVCEKDKDFLYSNKPTIYVGILAGIVGLCLGAMLVLYIFVARRLLARRMTKRHGTGLPRQGSGLPMVQSQNGVSPGNVVSDNGKPTDQSETSDNEFASSTELPSSTDNNNQTTVVANPSGINVMAIADSKPVRQDAVTVSGTLSHHSHHKATPSSQKKAKAARVRRKTLIMFILTVIFVVTTFIYFSLLMLISKNVLQNMSDGNKAVYFFFFRLVFINHVINPFVYGSLDSQFRSGLDDIRTKFVSFFSINK